MITEGGTIKLICEDSGETTGNTNTFLWSHDGQLLTNNTNILLFKNADPVVAGKYTCLVKNIAGEDFDVLEIIVTCEYVRVFCKVMLKMLSIFYYNGFRKIICSVTIEETSEARIQLISREKCYFAFCKFSLN